MRLASEQEYAITPDDDVSQIAASVAKTLGAMKDLAGPTYCEHKFKVLIDMEATR